MSSDPLLLGTISHVLIDDQTWETHYVVVRAVRLLGKGRALVDAASLVNRWSASRVLRTPTSFQSLRSAPPIDPAGSFTRAEEARYRAHLGWAVSADVDAPDEPSHLLASDLILGARLEAIDGDLGRVTDLVLSLDARWSVAAVAVRTARGQVLVPAVRLSGVGHRRVYADASRKELVAGELLS